MSQAMDFLVSLKNIFSRKISSKNIEETIEKVAQCR